MSSVVEKIQKRRFFPVELQDGRTVHVRPLNGWDKIALTSLKETIDHLALAVGRGLVEEDGTRRYPMLPKESVAEFVVRVRELTEEFEPVEITDIANAVTRVTKTPSLDVVVKNFEPTDAPAS